MTDLIAIFCEIDDFCKDFKKTFQKKLLSASNGKRKKEFLLTPSEVITIAIWFHFQVMQRLKIIILT